MFHAGMSIKNKEPQKRTLFDRVCLRIADGSKSSYFDCFCESRSTVLRAFVSQPRGRLFKPSPYYI